VRPFMNFWTLLNFPRREAPSDPARSAAWARGGYLVEGLGHCGACHTPMNVMMGPDFAKSLQGAVIEGLEAPSLTAAALSGRGYGIAPQGTSVAGMHTVTLFSTSAMELADVEAIATYLLTAPDGAMPPAKEPPAPLPEAVDPAPATPAPGRIVYVEACAGCHG